MLGASSGAGHAATPRARPPPAPPRSRRALPSSTGGSARVHLDQQVVDLERSRRGQHVLHRVQRRVADAELRAPLREHRHGRAGRRVRRARRGPGAGTRARCRTAPGGRRAGRAGRGAGPTPVSSTGRRMVARRALTDRAPRSLQQPLQVAHHAGELEQRGRRAQGVAVRARRVARPGLTRRHIAEHAGLAGHPARRRRWSGDRQCRPGRRATQPSPIRAEPAMPTCDMIRQRRPTDTLWAICTRLSILVPAPIARVVHAAAVDRGVRADLHVVADQAAPDVRNLRVRAVTEHVAEAVAAQPHARCARSTRAPIAGAGIAGDLRKEPAVLAQLHAGAHDAVRADPAPVAEDRAVADHGVGVDGHVAPSEHAASDQRRGVDPGSRAGCGYSRGSSSSTASCGRSTMIAAPAPAAARPTARATRAPPTPPDAAAASA